MHRSPPGPAGGDPAAERSVPDIPASGYRIGIAAALLLALALAAPGFRAPFGAEVTGWCGAFYATMARNMLALSTPVPFVEVSPDGAGAVAYTHHPPLVPWSAALAFALLGESEAAARLPMLLASLAAILVVARLARRELGTRAAGLVAALLLATMPLAAIFAHHLEVVGPLVLLASAGATSAYADLRAGRPEGGRLRLALWVAFAALTDWPALILVGILALHALLGRPRDARSFALIAAVGASTTAAVVLWLIAVSTGDGWSELVQQLGRRSYDMTHWDGSAIDPARLFRRLWGRALGYLGPALLLLLALWVGLRLVRRRAGTAEVSLALFAAVFLAVAPSSHFVHPFWAHPLAAGFALLGTAALAELCPRPSRMIGCGVLAAALGIVTLAGTRAHLAGWARGEARHHHLLRDWLPQRVPARDVVAVVVRRSHPSLAYYAGRPIAVVRTLEEVEPTRSRARSAAPAGPEARAAKPPPRWLLVHGDLAPGPRWQLVGRRGPYRLHRLR